MAVLGKIFGGPGPSSFGRQQRISEITIEPIKNVEAWARFGGPVPPPGPNLKLPLFLSVTIPATTVCAVKRNQRLNYKKTSYDDLSI